MSDIGRAVATTLNNSDKFKPFTSYRVKSEITEGVISVEVYEGEIVIQKPKPEDDGSNMRFCGDWYWTS